MPNFQFITVLKGGHGEKGEITSKQSLIAKTPSGVQMAGVGEEEQKGAGGTLSISKALSLAGEETCADDFKKSTGGPTAPETA